MLVNVQASQVEIKVLIINRQLLVHWTLVLLFTYLWSVLLYKSACLGKVKCFRILLFLALFDLFALLALFLLPDILDILDLLDLFNVISLWGLKKRCPILPDSF